MALGRTSSGREHKGRYWFHVLKTPPSDRSFRTGAEDDGVDSRDSLDRLRELATEAFARVAVQLARAEWRDATQVQVSPPSPERGLDVPHPTFQYRLR